LATGPPARYLATARVDVVAYGCTTGSFFSRLLESLAA
jgi:maleate cis-trans isomerase